MVCSALPSSVAPAAPTLWSATADREAGMRWWRKMGADSEGGREKNVHRRCGLPTGVSIRRGKLGEGVGWCT